MIVLLVIATALALVGTAGCVFTLWAASARRWVHRVELVARIELHDRDYKAGLYELNGWRDECRDVKWKLENAEKVVLKCKDEIFSLAVQLSQAKYDLRVAESMKLGQSEGESHKGNTLNSPGATNPADPGQ